MKSKNYTFWFEDGQGVSVTEPNHAIAYSKAIKAKHESRGGTLAVDVVFIDGVEHSFKLEIKEL